MGVTNGSEHTVRDSVWWLHCQPERSISKWWRKGTVFSTLCPDLVRKYPPQSWGGWGWSGGRIQSHLIVVVVPPPYQECQLAPGPCTFLPSVSKVGDSLATTKGQNKTLYKFCSQITVLWAIPFFQILYPLWTAHGNSWMIQATGWDSLFRKSFLGVSLYAQGTA